MDKDYFSILYCKEHNIKYTRCWVDYALNSMYPYVRVCWEYKNKIEDIQLSSDEFFNFLSKCILKSIDKVGY